jgi:hypothetical protein
MLREFLKHENFTNLIIAASVVIVLTTIFNNLTDSDKEIELRYEYKQAKLVERKNMLEKGYNPAYLECVRVSSRDHLSKCKALKE